MALQGEYLHCRDIDDLKIKMVLTDPDGSAPTYGAIYDNPGIQEFSAKLETSESESYGDGRILDFFSRVQKVTGSVKSARISHACAAAMFAGTTVVTGSTPNQEKETWIGDANLPYFLMDFTSEYVVGNSAGNGHFIVQMAKASNITVGIKMKDYIEVSFDFSGKCWNYKDPSLGFRPCFSFKEVETATTLSPSTADTTAPTVSSVTPSGTGQLATGNVVVTFSEAMAPSSVGIGTVILLNASGSVINWSAAPTSNAAGTVWTFPYAGLAATTLHRVIVGRGVKDLAGNALATANVSTFTTT